MMNVKVYGLTPEGDTQSAIWRFTINSTDENFTTLSRKIKDICGDNLNYETGATVYWKDPEGDVISCSTDVELQEALKHVQDSTIKILVRPAVTTPTEELEISTEEETSQTCPRRGVWFGPHRGRGGRRGGPGGGACPPHVRGMFQRMMAVGHGPSHGPGWMRRMWEETRSMAGSLGESSPEAAEKAAGSGPENNEDDEADLFPQGLFAWMQRFQQQRSRSPARGSGDEGEAGIEKHHRGPWMGCRQGHSDKTLSDSEGRSFLPPGMMQHFWRHKMNPNWDCPRQYCPVRAGKCQTQNTGGNCGSSRGEKEGCPRGGPPHRVRQWMRAMHCTNQSSDWCKSAGYNGKRGMWRRHFMEHAMNDGKDCTSPGDKCPFTGGHPNQHGADDNPQGGPWMRRGWWNPWRRFEGEYNDSDGEGNDSASGPYAHHRQGMMRHMWRHRMNPDWECTRKWCPMKSNKYDEESSGDEACRPSMTFHRGYKGCQAKGQHHQYNHESDVDTTAGGEDDEAHTCRRRQFWRRMLAQHGRSDGEDDTDEAECDKARTRHCRPHRVMAGHGCRGGPRGVWRRRYMRQMMQDKNQNKCPFQGSSSSGDENTSAHNKDCSKGFGTAPWMRRGGCREGIEHHPGMMRHFCRHKVNPDWECPRKCCLIDTEKAATATQCSAGQCKASGPPPFVRAMMAAARGGHHHPRRMGMVMRMRQGAASCRGRGRFGGGRRGGGCPMRSGRCMSRGGRGRGGRMHMMDI